MGAGRSETFFLNIISNKTPLHVEDTNVACKTPRRGVLCSWWSIRENGSGHVLRMRIYACIVAGNGIAATRAGG